MKHYRIAGLSVAMESFGRTVSQAQPYEEEYTGTPQITVSSNQEQMRRLQAHLSLEDCEYLCTGASFYTQLLKFEGLMLHASCVVMENRAYLFTADSGTGKSTHTGLWLQAFGEKAFILNDDKPALRLEDGIWYAYGTPWSGKYDISRNIRVPVEGIAVVERAAENVIAPFEGVEAIRAILRQVVCPQSAAYRIRVLELLDRLMIQIPVWKLQCNTDVDAALVSYRAMSGRKGEKI